MLAPFYELLLTMTDFPQPVHSFTSSIVSPVLTEVGCGGHIMQ